MEIIDEREMASHIQYDESSNPLCQRARKFFEQYIEELFTGDYSSVLEILFSQLEISKCQLFKNFIQINPFKLPPPFPMPTIRKRYGFERSEFIHSKRRYR